MTSDIVPVSLPLLDGNEKRYLAECIDTGWISSEGPFVRRLERDFADACGRKEGIAVCNGSAALDAAVAALELQPGDEVIVPSFTIISCAAAIVRAGGTPVPVDSDPVTWTMDPRAVEAAVTIRTRAIMPVHIYGLPCDMDSVMDIAAKHGLRIVEDAAEAHGLTYKGRPCGSFGEMSTFSFYTNKLVTTGEGGMILTDDDAIARRCRMLRNLCFRPEQRFVHDEFGWNLRMSNLQAAVGCAQLERLAEFAQRKRVAGALYRKLLSDIPGISLPAASTDAAENIYWVFGLVLDDHVPMDAGEAMRRLAALGIQTRPFFWPLHEQPVLRSMGLYGGLRLPVAERLARRGFYVPSGVGITETQQARVAEAVRQVMAEATA